jgi:nitroreductase / dihydropteridine reductase
MEFKDIVRQRYAVRQFEDRKVPEDLMQELLQMIVLAPSALNLQPWKIKVVTDQKVKDELYAGTWDQPQVKTCSHLLVLCADVDLPAAIDKLDKMLRAAGAPEQMRAYVIKLANAMNELSPEQLLSWAQHQVYIALGNALNGAQSLGLGAGPMTAFNPPDFSRILELPAHLVPTVLVAVGYPAGDLSPKMRYPVSDSLI